MTVQTDLEQSTPTSLAWLGSLGNVITDLLFPPFCAVCHQSGAWLCPHCLDKIETIHPPTCHRCGLPLDSIPPANANTPPGHRCRKAPSQLDGLVAYAFHSGPLRQAIHQLKYNDLRSLAVPLGRLMAEGWAALAPNDLDLDIIVPVPLHPTRQKQRGYNQSALLARELRTCLRRPLAEDSLVRTKATAPQVGLDVQERRANVHNAFRCIDANLTGKQVLLVDDVCTTGSTLEAACMALREAGISSVWAYTLARARGSGPDKSMRRRVENGIDYQG